MTEQQLLALWVYGYFYFGGSFEDEVSTFNLEMGKMVEAGMLLI